MSRKMADRVSIVAVSIAAFLTTINQIFRIQDSDRGPSFKLVEADGGLWKNATMKKIKEYLAYELAEELEKYNITIIA